MKRILQLVSGLMLGISLYGYTANQPILTFGVAPTFPPFEKKAPDGSLQGFDIELGQAICQQLHYRCRWVEVNFDGIIPALKAKKFDAILSAMFINEARQKQIDFTDKLYTIDSFLVAGKGSTLSPTQINSLKGHSIGVESGSIQETYVRKHWRDQGVRMRSYKDVAQIYMDLVNGRLDGAVLSGVSAQEAFLSKSQGQRFTFIGQALRDPAIFGVGAAIGVRKTDTQLKNKLNQAIAQIRHNGTYDRIAKQYFSFNIYGDPVSE